MKRLLLALAFLTLLTGTVHAADLSTGKGSTAYGYYYLTGTPDKAWDSDNSTASEWITNSGAGFDSNNTVDLNGTYTYSVTNAIWRGYDGSATYGFSKLYIYYSNDNSTWTLAQGITGNTLGQRQFNFSAIQARYWRLTARDQYGDGNYGYTSYAGIYGTIYVSGDSLTISNPTNTTIVNSSVTLTYNFSSVVSSNATCYRVIDGTSTLLGTVASNASNSYELTGLSIGSHNATVTCQPYSGANVSTSILFTRLDWLVNGNGYTTPVYETTNQTLVGSINTSTNVAILSATLFYNSTNQGINTSVTQTDRQSNTSRTITLPLLQVNNTNATLYWSYNLSWSNGTTIIVNTTSQTQSIWYAYTTGNFYVTPTTAGDGEDVETTLTVTNYTNTATLVVTNYLNESVYGTATQSNTNWTVNLTTPLIGSTTVTLYPYSNLNISFGGAYRTVNSSNGTLIVTQYSLNNCSSSTTYAINFTFRNEETDGSVSTNATMGATFVIRNVLGTVEREYNFTWTNVTTASLCISPAHSSAYVDSVQEYSASSYPVRYYYLSNATVDGDTPTTIYLYQLDSSIADLVQFTLINQAGVPQQGYTIQATRLYPGLNQYLLVDMGRTDQNGLSNMYLRGIDATHRFFAYENDTLIQDFTPQTISCTTTGDCAVQLVLTEDPLQTYTTYSSNVASDCTDIVSGGNNIVNCTYSDPSGLIHRAILQVNWIGLYQNTTACYTESSSASGTVYCNLGNATYRGYYWSFSTGFSPPQIIKSGIHEGSTTATFTDGIGLFLTAIALIAIGLTFANSPTNGTIAVASTALLLTLFGFTNLTISATLALICVTAVILITNKN